MPRLREVSAAARTLIEDLRAQKIPEREIVVGILTALQAAPVSKFFEEHAQVRGILDKAMGIAGDVVGLVQEVRKVNKEDGK